MAHQPSLLPVLKTFGLDRWGFYRLLQAYQGFVAGGAVSSAFFGKPLEDNQDLDVWIPMPVHMDQTSSYKASQRWDTATYCELMRHTIRNFFTKNKKSPSKRRLLNMSLDDIAHKYRGCYERVKTTDIQQYTNSTMAFAIQAIDTFENPWTGRCIQVIYTYDVSMTNILANFDFDVCQFYSDGSRDFAIKHDHSAETLFNLRRGLAKILNPSAEELMNDYQWDRLEGRVQKYEQRGYTFTWASTGKSWNEPELPPAPTESFWQDLNITTEDFLNYSKTEIRDYLRDLLDQIGCDFEGSDTDGNIDVIMNYMKARTKTDLQDGDNWQYTWRFTWDADNQEENIFVRKQVLLNPY